MKIVVTGRKTSVKDDFKKRLDKKIEKLDRFFDEQAVANITVTNQTSERETVEVTINFNGLVFRAEETTNDRTKSLELVVDSLIRQIRRNKTRLQKRLKTTAFEPISTDGKDEIAQEDYKIVKAKIFPVKPMAVEEAILQMNMLGHEFFMFRNCENDDINVVYRRKNGNYGLIEPEI